MPPELRRHPLLRVALLLFAFLALPSAASAYAPPYPIIDTTERASLGLFIAWLEDPGGNLGIDQVVRTDPARFVVSDHDELHFGYTRSSYWFRLALQNPQDDAETLLLEIPHPQLSVIELYRQADNDYTLTRSGTATERVIGDFAHQDYLFSVTVPANSTQVFWFRVQSDLALDFSIEGEQPEAFSHARSLVQVALGIAMGILLGLVLFNVVAWLVSRDATFGWYLLFLLAVITFLLAKLGYVGVLYLRGPQVQPLAESCAATAATLAAMQFARVFLGTRERQPAVDQVLFYMLAAGAVVLVALPLVPEASQRGPMYTTLAALAMPLTLYAGWRALRDGCVDAPLYIAARSVSAVAGLLVVISESGWFALPVRGVMLLVASATVEGVLIAWVLYARRSRMRREDVHEQLQQAVGQAELRARGEFLSRFSHDVRAPLTGILGMTELLGDTSLTPRQREYVLTIRTSGENLLALLNETLDWTRLESGQLEIQHADFDLPQLVAESMETVQLRAEEKHVELVVDTHPALPTRVNGDPARLRQVLCNLLGNAVRYTHRGEVQVRVLPADQPHVVRIEVHDTGVGIPRERLARLFEKDETRTGNSDNRGFGLLIARQLVERMGGRIGADSEEHRGSTFWIALPLPAALDQFAAADAAILAGKRLLVVDDNATVRRVIETQAASWHMNVTAADNAQEALALARTQANLGAAFDIVVLDHNMPGMSGLQLAARIKEDPLIRNDAVIVMLTGLNIAPTETMARNVGIRRVLTKPVSGRALQAALVEELARRESFEPEAGVTASPLAPNLRVLVVEDNHLSQKVIRGMLAKLGVRNDLVSNGQEALDAVQHQRYDLVLMDCEMPVMDGYEATRRIRAWEADNARRRTPVLALSAYILKEIKERCRQAGMDAHLAKPVDLNELREALRVYGVQ